MQGKLAFKWAVILIALFGSLYLLYPSYDWYKNKTERERELSTRPKHMINLGLDLKGGSSLLLEVEVDKLPEGETINETVTRAINIIRKRIDPNGVGEIPIKKQGDKWISVQLPGIANPEEAERLIGKTALLEFRIVKNDAPGLDKVREKIEYSEVPAFDADGNLIPEIAKLLPTGIAILQNRDGGGYTAVEAEAKVTGADLKSAQVIPACDNGRPCIGFSFSPEGGRKFGQLTGANISKQLAVVLDNFIQSAPTIQARITDQGTITGHFTMNEAKELKIVLEAGALPAPVKVIEKRTIGPSLGEDSIKSGLKAAFIGLAVIFIFMAIYYKMGGFISDVALCLNMLFLLAAMAYFNSALTLPGIAGIILSLAMAIDANVLILERMREEQQTGAPLATTISLGYDKAWSAILDSNITTWIVAAFLFQFGSGPVKGFALTLSLGLLVGVFTSVFVTRAIYELFLTSNPRNISL